MQEILQNYGLQLLYAGVLAILSYVVKKLGEKVKQLETVKGGMQALLRDRIVQAYDFYEMRGYIPVYAMTNVMEMYTKYHDLGGNGMVTELVERLMELPTEVEYEKNKADNRKNKS